MSEVKKNIFGFSIFFLTFLLSSIANAESWQKVFGGTGYDRANSIQQTSDGGYIVAGETASFGAGGSDIWVLKLDMNGNVRWQKTFGGIGYDRANSIQQTLDGGYIVGGETASFGAGDSDIWVLKLDVNGDVQWQKAYGGTSYEKLFYIQQTSDDGYVVTGGTASFGAGNSDIWVLKLDVNGDVHWQKAYGGSGYDMGYSIYQTFDGGYIVAGDTSFGAGSNDFGVLKLDVNGDVQWQKAFGGFRLAKSPIKQTLDGGYIVAGSTESFGMGGVDVLILKLDDSGNILWQKTYGGISTDYALSLHPTSDGGYVLGGLTYSFGAGGADFWALKIDSGGTVQWQKTYGGKGDEYAYSIHQTSDGGYVLGGITYSFGAWWADVLILKLDENGETNGCLTQGVSSVIVGIPNVLVMTPIVFHRSTDALTSSTSAAVINTIASIYICEDMPDLIVGDLSATLGAQGAWIKVVDVKYEVINRGFADSIISRMDFYLSRDTMLNEGALYIGSTYIDGLSEGAKMWSVDSFKLSKDNWQRANGKWYVIAVVDTDNSNIESDETNNLKSIQPIIVKIK